MYQRQYNPKASQKSLFRRTAGHKQDPKSSMDVDFLDGDGRSNMHLGVLNFCINESMFAAALKAGCKVELADHFGNKAIHYAAEKGLVTCVDKLVKKSASLDDLNKDGKTPLMLAVRYGHPAVVKSLVNAGANINLTNSKGELALHFGCAFGHKECVDILLKYKAKVRYPDNEGNTPLTLACKSSKEQIVEALLEKGARVDKVEESTGRSPVILATLVGNLQMVKVLLTYRPNLDAMDKYYKTAFMYAIMKNMSEILCSLMDANCDRSTIDGLNGTAMALAALRGFAETVQTLLDAGEDPDEFGFFGMTALMAAAYESQTEIVEMLLKGGSDPMNVSRMGLTTLMVNMCHLKPQNSVARHRQAALLIKYGADVNYKMNNASLFTDPTNGKNCAISFAIAAGYTSLVKMYLLAGSSIKVSDLKDFETENDSERIFNIRSVIAPVIEYRSQPVKLQQSCRFAIRKQLRSQYVSKISKLPIASPLKDYLNFHDLFSIEPEMAPIDNTLPDIMMTMVNVRACGLGTLKGSFLHDMIHESVIEQQTPGQCNCNTCQRVRALSTQRSTSNHPMTSLHTS